MPLAFELPAAWPYVGSKYGVVAPFQLRILILGESHYRDRPLTKEFTREVVQSAIDGATDPSLRFFAKTAGVFFGGPQSPSARQEYWQTVAFYNFIQEPVGSAARIRPTKEMWPKAVPAFREVLTKLQPEFVLVLGAELWRQLSIALPLDHPFRLPVPRMVEACSVPLASGQAAFFFPINHPSSPGWNYGEWSPLVRMALEEARKQKGWRRAPEREGARP